ncbi:glycosyltransferase [Candidatus Peregrinibacteria bacterium]|nr:glycosyltransferase [Candidatus Peregrinibacteria bacterium]
MANILVSVVVTTKNEEKHIAACLDSIKGQSYKNVEIIVVDNNSEDKTKEIALKYTPHVFNHGPERGAQRNYGLIKKAKGEYVMFVDADMTLSPHVIADCVERIKKDSSLVGLYISEIVTGNSFWSKVRRFERSFYDGTVIDCVRFIKRDKFVEVGGFDESLTGGEDWDLDKKLRQIGKTVLARKPIYHNEAEFNLKKYLHKKKYYAQSFSTYIAKWGKNDPDIKKQFGFWYRFFGVFTENGKWKKLVGHPILMVGMYSLRVKIGLIFLTI